MAIMNLILVATLTIIAAPMTRPASVPASQTSLVVTAPQFDRLVASLNDPRFSVREEASSQLCRLDPSFLPKLADRYRTVIGEEAKHRLRYAMETIYYQRELAGRCGFIGISLSQQTATDMIDPTDGRKCYGVYVMKTIDGLPAARAGMKDLDIIIGLNGQPLPASPSSQKFISLIERTPPGTTVQLRVLRAEKPVRQVTIRPGKDEDSPTLGLKLSAPPTGTFAGVRVIEVAPNSAAAAGGLKINDVISSVNGISLITTFSGLDMLTSALQAAGPAKPVPMTVQSCTETRLDVTVGRRPLEFLRPEDKLSMQAGFARWWREHGGQWQPSPDAPRPNTPFIQIPEEPQQDRNSIIP
jgi:hypothetical protein